MSTRTTSRTLVFPKPFALTGFDDPQPAGVYVVEIDEEQVEGVSFLAYRRTSTRLRLPPDPAQPGIVEIVTVDPAELEAALPGATS
jgi:hypothetical protein